MVTHVLFSFQGTGMEHPLTNTRLVQYSFAAPLKLNMAGLRIARSTTEVLFEFVPLINTLPESIVEFNMV